MKKQKYSIENKLAGKVLLSIRTKESFRIVEDKYRNYMNYVLDIEKYKFEPLPKLFSTITDKFIKYKRECEKNEM